MKEKKNMTAVKGGAGLTCGTCGSEKVEIIDGFMGPGTLAIKCSECLMMTLAMTEEQIQNGGPLAEIFKNHGYRKGAK
jgi:hypothetical protein